MFKVKKVLILSVAAMLILTTFTALPVTADAARKKAVKVKKVQITRPKGKTLTLERGTSYQLKTKVTPKKATNKKLSYKSSNQKIVKVNAKGSIRAIKNGKATITVKAKDKSKKNAKISVNVVTYVSDVTITSIGGTIKVSDTLQLTAMVRPNDASNKKVTWASSNRAVATVSDSGAVRGIKAGTVTITATSKDGKKKKATFIVKVENKTDPTPQGKKITGIKLSGEGVTGDVASYSLSIPQGTGIAEVNAKLAALDIKATVEGGDADIPLGNARITWKVSSDYDGEQPGTYMANASLTAPAGYVFAANADKLSVTVAVLMEIKGAGLKDFPLSTVKVTDEYYENVARKDIDFLKTFDPDRLLSRYRQVAGLPTGGKNSYQGWETTQIAGHTLGHYLTACAQAYQTTSNPEDKEWIREKLEYLIDELLVCQNKEPRVGYEYGFIFGSTSVADNNPTNKEYQFDVVEGKVQGSHWVPWYNMHKVMTGIVATYHALDYEPAKTLGSALGDWVYNRASQWDQATHTRVLNIEFGAMNDCLYELYKITGKEEHLTAAHKFDQESLFNTIATGAPNVLNGRHANTTIPKYVGAINRYRTLKDTEGFSEEEAARYLGYCEGFWDMVLKRHTYITGANSQWEHFRNDNTLDGQRTQCNNETCNVHNMLLLSRELFKITGDKKYADFYETAFINSIMASINPADGSTAYFQPMATGYYKVYSNPDVNQNLWWCCTGTGLENFTKLGDSIYFYKDDTVVVNQYLSSELSWEEKGVTLYQETDLPVSDVSNFTVALTGNTPLNFTLALRLPDWLKENATIQINNQDYIANIMDGYAMVNRNWKTGDTVSIRLPMEVVAYGLPDNESAFSFKYGPVVLAAELGSDAEMEKRASCGWWVALPENKRVGTDTANPGDGQRAVLKSETLVLDDASVDFYTKNISSYLVKGEDLNFTLNSTKISTTGETLTFSPYYKLHGQRYGVYWYFSGRGDNPDHDALLQQKEDGRSGRTQIDALRAGYRVQDEEDAVHQIQDNGGTASTGNQADPVLNVSSRYANADGFFTYRMIVDKGQTNYLTLQLPKDDNGKPLKITSGTTELFNERLNYIGENELYKKRILIPAAVVAAAETITVSAGGESKTIAVIPVTFTGAPGEASARLAGTQSINMAYSTNASIDDISSNIGTVTKTGNTYTVSVPSGTEEVGLEIDIRDSFGLLYIDNALANDSLAQTIQIKEDEMTLRLKVYAEDHETFQEYTLVIQRDSVTRTELDVYRYFSFDDTLSGAVPVSGGGSKNPTEVSVTPSYVAGKYGKAVRLPGSYGLRLGTTAGLGEDYTISWWMKPDSIRGQYDPLFNAGTFSPEYWISATHDAKVWSNDGTKRSMPSANAYIAGTWQHVAFTVKASSATGVSSGRLYLNGNLIASGEVARGIMERANGLAYFGANYWDAVYQGDLDDLVLIKGVLNQAEIRALRDHVLSPAN